MAFSMNGDGPSSSLSEINVTPLVDVMLVLLIIFMISAPLMQSGVTLELPEGNENMQQQEDAVVLSIDAEGRHHLGDTYLQPDIVMEKVRAALAASPDKVVFLRGDQSLSYGTVMDLLNRLKEAGIQEVSLVTEPPKQK